MASLEEKAQDKGTIGGTSKPAPKKKEKEKKKTRGLMNVNQRKLLDMID